MLLRKQTGAELMLLDYLSDLQVIFEVAIAGDRH
jgi:hypothetical protein